MKSLNKKKSAAFALALSLIFVLLMAGCQKTGPDYLVLVNKENLISSDYIATVSLCDIENVDGGVYQVEETTKKAFEALQSDLKEKGIEIGVDSAYRSVERQQEIMDDFIRDYGEDYAKKTVAIPGTSEHHTGLVIDLVPKADGEWVVENEDMLKETEIFEKIHAKAPEYGFIVRYPAGKEAITGYDYQPWVLRYVGEKAAKEITEQGLTLEEYLQ